jgi:hypothetical protein
LFSDNVFHDRFIQNSFSLAFHGASLTTFSSLHEEKKQVEHQEKVVIANVAVFPSVYELNIFLYIAIDPRSSFVTFFKNLVQSREYGIFTV